MRWHRETITLPDAGRGLHDITVRVREVVGRAEVQVGLCNLFLLHTSASLLIQENADPDVLRDLEDWFARQAPDGDPRYRHVEEGPDDMSAHIRSAITATSLTVPIEDGALLLGVWQSVYLFEHRAARAARRLVVTALGPR
jgi:secondary thiamine-phosphate synthase enzyme